MDTAWKRVQAVGYFSLSVVFVLALLSHVSVYSRVPDARVVFVNPRVDALTAVYKYMRLDDGSTGKQPGDRATIRFDLDADLRDVFDWNVKQLFVFITASYNTTARPSNEATIWDTIVPDRESAHLQIKDLTSEYDVFDPHSQLKGTPLRLTLYWDVMPTIGMLKTGSSRGTARAVFTADASGARAAGSSASVGAGDPVMVAATAYAHPSRSQTRRNANAY